MPSDLERAMETLITVFHRYASKEAGNTSTLSRKELKMLMEAELASFLKSQKDRSIFYASLRSHTFVCYLWNIIFMICTLTGPHAHAGVYFKYTF
uniref:S100/CaBP-9k-type calcium binding subdomain domain-containing protein n=1 Tax=Cyprinus carpio carpio TaxID=630221 RepID=A0A9J7X3P9_CYPCA